MTDTGLRRLRFALAALAVALTGCQPQDAGASGALPDGEYVCWSVVEDAATRQSHPVPVGVTIQLRGRTYAVTGGDGGTYRNDPATGRVTWDGGELAGTPTSYEHEDGRDVLVLQRGDGGSEGQWHCIHRAGDA